MKGLLSGAGFIAAIAAVIAACSSTGSSPSSAGGEGNNNDNGVSVVPGGSTDPSNPSTDPNNPTTGGDDAGDAGPTATKDAAIGTPDQPTSQALCAQDNAGFNLSNLTPLGAPAAVVTAWNNAVQNETQPGLVLGLRGAYYGPVSATIGSVRAFSGTDYIFNGPPSSISNVTIAIDPANPLGISFSGASDFVSSFSNGTLNGFAVASASLQGVVDGACTTFTGNLTLLIPDTSKDTPFGGTTVGAAFGAPTETINGGNDANAWVLNLQGTASVVNMNWSTP